MTRYLAWRLALVPPSVLVAATIVFFLLRVLPGDIAAGIAGDVQVSPEAREALREELGLNEPPAVQYGKWLWSMAGGDFGGVSLETGEPVQSIVARQLPITLLLAVYAGVLSVAVSLPLGVLAAVKRNRWPDYLVRVVTLGSLAMPDLWIALLVLLGFLLAFQWSPPIIYTAPWSDAWNHAQMMVWPALILTWEYSSHVVRVTRAGMLEAFGAPFVTTARGKGLQEKTVVLRHAFRNALVPSVTVLGLQFTRLLGGAVILETIFGLPGIGRGLVHATLARDYPVILGQVMALVVLAMLVNLVVDLVYSAIDPRISHST